MEPRMEGKERRPDCGPLRIEAPWSEEQIAALNFSRQNGVFHPYTSPRCLPLIATTEGWRECAGGPVIQSWADSSFFDRTTAEAQLEWTGANLLETAAAESQDPPQPDLDSSASHPQNE